MNQRRLIPSMSWLVAFESAARHLSFTRAGQELSLTQSAVSRHVQSLEEMLEVSLFRRDGRQIELTQVGEMYLRELRGVLQHIRNASLHAIAYRSGGGTIKLAAPTTFASKWLGPRLTAFNSSYPEILTHVYPRDDQFDFELAALDAAVGLGDGNWPGLVSHHLFEEQLVPIISPALAAKRPLNQPAHMREHILLQLPDRLDAWRRWLELYGEPTDDLPRGPQFELISHLIQAAVAGIGVGLVPSCLVEEELSSGSLLVPFDAPLKTGSSYYLFVPPGRTLPPSLALLVDWLLEVKRPDLLKVDIKRETGCSKNT